MTEPNATALAFGQMSGLELMRAVLERKLPPAGIAESLTFELVEVAEGVAVFEGETGPHVLNPAGGVHGGWALTMIDSATACAAHTLLPAGVGYASLSTQASFDRPIRVDTGRVRCEGRVVNAGRQIISAEATVKDAEGRLLAHGVSTIMVLQPRA